MEKKKVAFFLIKAFSDADKQVFKQKIKSVKATKNGERLEKLYTYFERAVEADDIEELKTTKLVRLLRISSARKLTPLYSELIDALKAHLIESETQQNALNQQLLLYKALCRREENTYIEVLHEEIRTEINEQKRPTLEDYQNQASFYNSLYLHPNTNTRKEEALVYLNRSEVNLDTSYWIGKLRLLVEKANRGITISGESFLLDELPTLPDLTPYTFNNEHHILSIYAKVYQFALAPFTRAELDEVLDVLTQSDVNIEHEDKERILNYLMGLISYYIAGSKTDLNTQDTYRVHKIGFTNLWLVQNDGFIYFEDFINMLYLAFNAKDTELLETISIEYAQYIPDGYHPFIDMLSKAYNFFLHQQWEHVLRSFSNQDLPNKEHRLHFIMHRNTLEIKTLFEALIHDKVELDDIPSFQEKHNRFLQRKSTTYSNHFKMRNVNFSKFLKRLYSYLTKRLTFDFDKTEAREEIKTWLDDVKQVGKNTIDQAWLQSIGQTLLDELEINSSQASH